MHEANQQIQYVKSVLDKLIKHPFVERHIDKPFIDENKLKLSYFIFRDHIDEWQVLEKNIVSTALVQIAIDTHENIHAKDELPMKDIKKQLNVLIGDYYSGLYYYILSELEDIDMISIVAQSIKAINEQKMNLLYTNINSVDELVYTYKEIESIFYKSVAKRYGKSEYFDVIEQFLLVNFLKKEYERFALNKPSTFVSQLNEIINSREEISSNNMSLMDKILNDAIEALNEKLNNIQNTDENDLINFIKYAYNTNHKTSAVKEGL